MGLEQIIGSVFEWINRNGLVSSIIAFASTLLITLGTGFIQEIFKKREEKRLSIENFVGKVTDVVADATSSGYRVLPSSQERERMTRAAAQLERLGKAKISLNIRSFLNGWLDYWERGSGRDSVRSFKKFPKEEIELRKKLDNLADVILGKK